MAESKTETAKTPEQLDKANQKLVHSDENAPESTRMDAHDVGVPMLAGDPKEPQGPEDALGRGPKRGDYRDRVVGNPHQAEPVPEDEREEDGPVTRVVPQYERTSDIGDAKGEKGGVTTDPAYRAGTV